MRFFLGVLCLLGLAYAVPVGQEVPGFDENYPEEVPGLFEGDIVLLPGEKPWERNALKDRSRRWANGVLPYEIQTGYTASVQQLFKDAMHEIEQQTAVNGKQCIKFVPRTNEAAYIRFSQGTGCHTPVGWIGRMSAVTIGHGCERKGTIMHEVLHALGFFHEQSRPDRDNYVTIHWDNIEKGHEGNFQKYTTDYVDTLGQPYDYGSIMHYDAYGFAIDRSRPAMEPKKPGVTIGQRVRLSDTDIKKIQLYYGCTTSSVVHTPAPTVHATVHATVTAAPHGTVRPISGGDFCNFDQGLCTWKQSHTDNTDWTRYHGSTPSVHTGPSRDHMGSQTSYYIYLEASGHFNQVARLDSKDYPGGDYCVDFFYNMYGTNMGYLQLNVMAGNQHVPLRKWSGDHGDQWYHERMNVHIQTTATFEFEFEGHAGPGHLSDIAIDDITIHPGSC